MSNELLFLSEILITFSLVLLCFRLGKEWLYGFIIMSIILMNILVVKQMTLFGFALTGANVLYAGIFLSTDLIEEFYGKKAAYRIVMMGFGMSVISVIMTQFGLAYIANEFDTMHPVLEQIFTLTPRIVAGSLIAYLISQNLDIWLYNKIQNYTGKRYLWLRNNVSTLIAQAFDTVIFHGIAFYGVLPNLTEIIIVTYIFKACLAIADTPFVYLAFWKRLHPKREENT